MRALLLGLFLLACGPNTGDSNTNWLVRCDRDAQCGEDALCLCGVCTTSCTDDAACRALDPDGVCLPPEARSCGGDVPLCVPSCALGCDVGQVCRDDVCVPDPWVVDAPRNLRLVRCMMPDGAGGCVAGNEVFQLVLLGRDGSATVSDPAITGVWTQPGEGVELAFDRAGSMTVTFPGARTSEPGCFAGGVDDPNLATPTTWSGCLLD
ncbi:MAG: hypothetical protein H6721_17355 [Sandaracinus sp.]|nr:hypothetical protein [Sandaracinus sp.]MCB9633889.1 hypothetical protein [Sandaracinus sp.]